MEEYVEGLNNARKDIVQMVFRMSEDITTTLEVIRAVVVDLSTKLNLTIRVTRIKPLLEVQSNLTK